MAILANTNAQIYLDLVDLAVKLKEVRDKCLILTERLYAMGIPNDPANGGQTAVVGFEDAMDLTKADVAVGLGLCIDTKNFLDDGKLQAIAKILRNRMA